MDQPTTAADLTGLIESLQQLDDPDVYGPTIASMIGMGVRTATIAFKDRTKLSDGDRRALRLLDEVAQRSPFAA